MNVYIKKIVRFKIKINNFILQKTKYRGIHRPKVNRRKDSKNQSRNKIRDQKTKISTKLKLFSLKM